MKKMRYSIGIIVILIVFSLIFVSGDEVNAVIQALEGQMQIYYNGSPLQLEKKPVVVNGFTYLPVHILANLFNKTYEWNAEANRFDLADKPDLRIKEQEERIKQLEDEVDRLGKDSLEALEEEINTAYGEHGDMTFQILLSGCEEDIRVRMLVDLGLYQTEWNRFKNADRLDYLKNICSTIAGQYPNAIVKGYFCNIKSPNRLISFFNTPSGEVKTGSYKNYSTISSLEDKINFGYNKYFSNICLVYELSGNENRVDFNIYMPFTHYEAGWEKLSDSRVKSLMNKIIEEIEKEFKESHIYGNIYVSDGGQLLASCWKEPRKGLEFVREQ